MTDLSTYIEVAKVVWPIAAWVAWVNHNVKQNRIDIDKMYCEKRGGKGMRKTSLKGRWQRWTHNLRKHKDGNSDHANTEPIAKADQPETRGQAGDAGPTRGVEIDRE